MWEWLIKYFFRFEAEYLIDGRKVIFPFGPIKAFLLDEEHVHYHDFAPLLGPHCYTILSSVILSLFIVSEQITLPILILVTLFTTVVEIAWYYYALKAVSQNLVTLPFALGLKIFAAKRDPEKLHKEKVAFWMNTSFMVLFFSPLKAKLLPPFIPAAPYLCYMYFRIYVIYRYENADGVV